jgi:hypothetical protein
MYLEDAMLALYIDIEESCDSNIPDFCTKAIDGGIDMIVIDGQNTNIISEVADVCKREDALLSLTNISLFDTIHADCFLNMANDVSIGQAAGMLCNGEKNGQYVTSLNDAMMATEVGVDFLVFQQDYPDKNSLMAIESAIPIYVGKIKSFELAKEFANNGIIRMMFDMKDYDNSLPVTDYYAAISKTIGRSF